MEKKITYAQALHTVLDNENIVLASDVREKLEALLSSVSKKSGEKKETAQQVENATMVERIYQEMEANRTYSIAELIKELPVVADFNAKHENDMTTQRIANLLRTLVENGKVIKTTEKRRVYYTKA
jgi:hypothetical protein